MTPEEKEPIVVHDIEHAPAWFLLEKKALVAELRLLVIASVALNQFLGQVNLPKEVTVPALAAAIIFPFIKSILVMRGGA